MERLDLDPTLSLPWTFGRFANASATASWRQDAWLFENNPLPADLSGAGQTFSQAGTRGYPVLDLELGSEISRDFGSGSGRVQHSIDPQIELRAIPFQLLDGTVPPLWLNPVSGGIYDHSTTRLIATSLPLPYDEIDTAAGLTAPLRTTAGTLSPPRPPVALLKASCTSISGFERTPERFSGSTSERISTGRGWSRHMRWSRRAPDSSMRVGSSIGVTASFRVPLARRPTDGSGDSPRPGPMRA